MGELQSQLKLGLIVGVPIEGRPDWETGRAVTPEWAFTIANLLYPTGCNHTMMAVKGKRIDEARNEIIQKAIDLDVKYVFFLDDDVRPPIDTLLHLYPVIDSDPDCIAAGGIYSPKRKPVEPMAYRKASSGPSWDFKYGEVFEVEGIATGCLLVKVDLMKKIEQPWFKTINNTSCVDGVLESVTMTDDLYFCRKAIDAGYKIKAHGGLLSEHLDADNHKIYKLPKQLFGWPST